MYQCAIKNARNMKKMDKKSQKEANKKKFRISRSNYYIFATYLPPCNGIPTWLGQTLGG